MLALARALLTFLMPGGILLLGAAALSLSSVDLAWPPALFRFAPYGVLSAAFLLGWRFNRSRPVFAVLVLVLADRFLASAAGQAFPPADRQLAHAAVTLLLPLNLAILSLLQERGLFSGRGLWRLFLILLQPVLLFFLYRSYPGPLSRYLQLEVLPGVLPARLPLPPAALLLFGGVFLLLAVRLWIKRSAMENGFFWALPAVFLGLVLGPPDSLAMGYTLVAAAILLVAILEDAHGMAFRDELTGLPARRALNEAMLRLGSRYAIAMLDVDFFKKFNDRYGHQVGDQVLRMIAAKLGKVAGGGKPYRFGGEEFTVLFPGRTLPEAQLYLEQLRAAIAETDFTIRGPGRPRRKPKTHKPVKGARQKVSITISIGVAAAEGRQLRPQEVLKAADKALYRAKKGGRNRVAT